MQIDQISFKNFRNLNSVVDLSNGVNLLIDRNGAGKSNFLDGIYHLSQAKSFRKYTEGTNIAWDTTIGFARIRGKVRLATEAKELGIIFSTIEDKNFKKYEVNGVAKKKNNFSQQLIAILFAPQDLDIISGSPDTRRDELDEFLSHIDYKYADNLKQYKNVVKSRNKLFGAIADRKAGVNELNYWDEKLIELGSFISSNRLAVLKDFVPEFRSKALSLFGGEVKDLGLEYISRYADLKTTYDQQKIREVLSQKIKEGRYKELAAKKSLYGPHRDDFEILFNTRPIKIFGSRGQQRLAALILKVAMLEFLSDVRHEMPILLLDDVMSELDETHRKNLEDLLIELGSQVIITGTDNNDYTQEFLERINLVKIS